MLIKGLFLCTTLVLLLVMGVLGVEYFLWLPSMGRFALLLLGLVLASGLLYKYIFVPLLFLFKIRHGISNRDASIIIGAQFPDVKDKLHNLLDLVANKDASELLRASILQRSRLLRSIPFQNAINFRAGIRYVKFIVIPIGILFLLWISGRMHDFFVSYERVINYSQVYEVPAPFKFQLVSTGLRAIEDEPYKIQVVTTGNLRPASVQVVINGKAYAMQRQEDNFEYSAVIPIDGAQFYFEANGIKSKEYTMELMRTPVILDFEMTLSYPKYLMRDEEVIRSTGNATIPEGTEVEWRIVGRNTDSIHWVTADAIRAFERKKGDFRLRHKVDEDLNYTISTSNEVLKEYERVPYGFRVIADAFPTISVSRALDSLEGNEQYFRGSLSDDYGLSTLKVVYFPEGLSEEAKQLVLRRPVGTVDSFYYAFPDNMDIEADTTYEFYFEVTDNDGIRGGKASRTEVFKQRIYTDKELYKKELDVRQTLLENFSNSKEGILEQTEVLEELRKNQKEDRILSFNEQRKIKEYLERQLQQEGLMKNFSKQIKESLAKNSNQDELNELLQERLERQEMEAQKNQELLRELEQLAEKMNKDELQKKLDELGNKQKNNQRGLEQLVELTKRYYVSEKSAQLARELEKLSEQQEILSNEKESSYKEVKEQETLNDSFIEIKKEIDELREDNRSLKKPLELPDNGVLENGIREDQKDALNELQEEEQGTGDATSQKRANEKQKSAANKMKELSEQLGSSSSGDSEATMAEDAAMLRQILDNLVLFSFKQEGLYEYLNNEGLSENRLSSAVRQQQELKLLFEHVDDSLLSLSLRRAELSEFVNEQIGAVYYNIDRSIDRLVQGQWYQGVSYQQYVITASNELADFLVTILENMQQSLRSGEGSGQGNNFQLPDIIQGQGELRKKLGQMGSGEKEGEGKGSKGNSENGKEGSGTKGGKGEGTKGSQYKHGEGATGEEIRAQEVFEIYKEQQFIKERLEEQLQNMINGDDRKIGEKLIEQMEDFQNNLIENGVTFQSIAKMNTIQYELLKLKDAQLKQGEEEERKSNTNLLQYNFSGRSAPEFFRNYQNQIEVLQRQVLPLQNIFQDKVRDYFKGDD
ncbi:DUF4175 family protein [Arenibacter sp. GZD96]|uniref:DUF4175 family protein n=1 Tax=Aurantibrevibacter litoralis TaxID=3106030 RepID=UPI002AFDE1B3|nr:DUF4175 family protein [Arenibacter sp. GZD-96]MEA1786470.1 DUF4175 family protein [Arenibacter sp. GZD-96]